MSLPDGRALSEGRARVFPALLNSLSAAIIVAAAAAVAGPAAAANTDIDAIEAPRSAISGAYQAAATAAGNRSDAVYARRITGDLPLDKAFRAPEASRAPRTGPSDAPLLSGPMTMVVVFALLIGALALWLRFGGSGGLLSAQPRELRQKPAAPDGWRLTDDGERPAAGLLADIAAMPDRRAGLIRLLRHCLLHAAAATGTRFARSDTEREALRRLPGQWDGRADLTGLLQTTELAHYGGRPVAEDAFAQSLAAAQRLLMRHPGQNA